MLFQSIFKKDTLFTEIIIGFQYSTRIDIEECTISDSQKLNLKEKELISEKKQFLRSLFPTIFNFKSQFGFLSFFPNIRQR